MKLAILGTSLSLVWLLMAEITESDQRVWKDQNITVSNSLGTLEYVGSKKKRQKIFRIYNRTTEVVRINSVTATENCRCSVPIWTTGRIKPGKYGLVMVVFSQEQEGHFDVPLRVYFYNNQDVVDDSLTQDVVVEGSL